MLSLVQKGETDLKASYYDDELEVSLTHASLNATFYCKD